MNKNKTIQATVLAIAIAAACSSATAQEAALFESYTLPDAVVFESKNVMSMDTDIDMIITGPEDFYLRESFDAGEPIEFIPTGLPDGTYRYDLRVMSIRGVSSDRNSDRPAITESLEGGSGTFSIQGGQIVPSNVVEAPYKASHSTSGKVVSTDDWVAEEDQVIPDDLEVQGSLCVGFDCVNGESFGFDTIRLKENNTRIKFEDTSVGTFPSTDWQLTANDSASGGANKFSIEDITAASIPFTVEGSAPSNSLYIDSSGRIGLGTSAPVLQAHIADGNTPGLRLDQDGSAGWAPQIWDVAGNEANFFVRDVTNGSKLPFRIRPGAPQSSIDIAADGDVGMGTASPQAALHINETTGNAAEMIRLTNDGGSFITFENTSSNDTWFFTHQNANEGAFIIDSAIEGAGDGPEFMLKANGDLEIQGNFISAGTTLNVPDYVFEPGYDLRTLSELASFIAENGHLPNVPSAEEVAENGLNMTQLYLTLLEKIEELTLYTIDQEERIEALEAKLQEISSVNN